VLTSKAPLIRSSIMSARTGSRDNDRRPPFSSEEARWQAVERRDSDADGRFWYSVETTGVYCRPSCAARRPRRDHVRFHASPMEAERAGFRPCKRCRPNEPSLAECQAATVAKACRTIEQAESLPDLDALARSAGMSRFHFHRVFKACTGLTPKAYADAHRGRRARDELRHRRTITEAIYGSGFNASGRFYGTTRDLLGMTPTQYRAGGRGATIHFAAGQCWLGAILVAASERGICAIELGDDPDRLVRGLQDRFPQAQLVGGDRSFEQLVASVVGLIEAPANGASLPLDVHGTAFQQRVWQALRKIPAGSTATYADIARRIGRPKAVRAVARACASNEIAVAIPCHRVVRTDGALSGYRWGVERKQALLDREAKSATAGREKV
jgi:AraC family transcriptional regulator of adaptative response/methylated-DNA-[protein]-cysteine methyltransferase